MLKQFQRFFLFAKFKTGNSSLEDEPRGRLGNTPSPGYNILRDVTENIIRDARVNTRQQTPTSTNAHKHTPTLADKHQHTQTYINKHRQTSTHTNIHQRTYKQKEILRFKWKPAVLVLFVS